MGGTLRRRKALGNERDFWFVVVADDRAGNSFLFSRPWWRRLETKDE